jgi:NAD-dependent SIR2 family protein deacetylase
LFRKRVGRQEDLEELAKWVLTAPGLCTVITTNYDMLLESEIYPRMGSYAEIWEKIDFGFSPREPQSGTIPPRPARPVFRLYKLHGSLNWLRCARCDRIYINPHGHIYSHSRSITREACHCFHAPLRR